MRSTDRGRSRRRKAGRALDASVSGSARRVPRGQVLPQRRELRVHLLFFLCGGRGREEVAGESNAEESEEKRSTRQKRIPEARRRARRGHARVSPYLAMRSRDNYVALPSRCGCVGASRRGSPAPTRGRSTRACRKCKMRGVSRTPRRNVGFRFASLALRPMETLELRAAFGVARAVGSRAAFADVWSRASRRAFCLRAPRRCAETCQTLSSLFASKSARPFLPARHERGGNVTRTAGDSTVRAWRAFRILQIAGFLRTRLQSDSRRGLNSVQPRFVARFVSKPPARMEKIRGVAISRITGEPPNGTRRFRI